MMRLFVGIDPWYLTLFFPFVFFCMPRVLGYLIFELLKLTLKVGIDQEKRIVNLERY